VNVVRLSSLLVVVIATALAGGLSVRRM